MSAESSEALTRAEHERNQARMDREAAYQAYAEAADAERDAEAQLELERARVLRQAKQDAARAAGSN